VAWGGAWLLASAEGRLEVGEVGLLLGLLGGVGLLALLGRFFLGEAEAALVLEAVAADLGGVEEVLGGHEPHGDARGGNRALREVVEPVVVDLVVAIGEVEVEVVCGEAAPKLGLGL
jgi:hypothetical protein